MLSISLAAHEAYYPSVWFARSPRTNAGASWRLNFVVGFDIYHESTEPLF